MRALVTGAHGFLGSHLVDHLLEQGIEVRALVSPWGKLDNLGDVEAREGLEIRRGDVSDADSLGGSCEDCELVYHAAARAKDWGRWAPFQAVNVDGTANLLAEAERAGVRRWIQISSVAVHEYTGFRDADPRTTPRGGRIVHYARSKLLAEELVTASPIEHVIARPGLWPFGPRDPNLGKMLDPIAAGKFPMPRDGKSVINTAYVGNLVDGLHRAGTRPEAAGQTYVFADEGAPSWREAFDHLASLMGAPRPGPAIPCWLSASAGWMVDRLYTGLLPNTEPPLTTYRGKVMCQDIHFSIAAARDELGYAPAIDWREGLRRTLAATGRLAEAA